MAKNQEQQDRKDSGCRERWLFRLYIAGQSPESLAALNNIRSILEEYLPGCHELTVMDVVQYPLTAIKDGILVTPTLLKIYPHPFVRIVGNLNDQEQVVKSLDLPGHSSQEER